MRFETVKDIIEVIRQLHEALSRQYAELEQLTTSERAALMLDYLARHERRLAAALQHYEQDAARGILETWLQYAPSSMPRRWWSRSEGRISMTSRRWSPRRSRSTSTCSRCIGSWSSGRPPIPCARSPAASSSSSATRRSGSPARHFACAIIDRRAATSRAEAGSARHQRSLSLAPAARRPGRAGSRGGCRAGRSPRRSRGASRPRWPCRAGTWRRAAWRTGRRARRRWRRPPAPS